MTASLAIKQCPMENVHGDVFCFQGKIYRQDDRGGACVIDECCRNEGERCVKAAVPHYVAPDRCPTCGAHLRCGCDDPVTGLPRTLDRSLLKKEREVIG